MNRQLVPLSSTDPDTKTNDLAALDPFLRDRRIVAVGEATHGTKEFFDLKHRLFRHLAEHHGHTVMAMELPFAASVRIDDYVKGAAVDPRELVQGIHWFVDSEEFIALFRWMRQYNAEADPPQRLEVFGFDIQRPRDSAVALAERLASARPELSERYGETLTLLASSSLDGHPDLEGLGAALERLRDALLGAPALDHRAMGHLEVLRAHLDIVTHCGDRFGCQVVKRDMFMAHNLRRRLEETNARALVWAHNGHVGRAAHPDGWRPMGHHLSEWLGDELYVIGLEFDHGGFVAPSGGVGRVDRVITLPHLGDREVAEYVLDPAPPGTLPHMLAQARASVYFLPLAEVGADPEIEGYFMRTRKLHEYGGTAPTAESRYADQTPVHASYDALVFIERTHGYTFVR